mmetsp:Transcript_2700/g.9558  ORF Transcript_2700/g.9558 Transcript_2700/m.9558 type:complete len:139 (+) Transcript_2700:3-419(+)
MVSSTDVFDSYFGQSEKRLLQVFEEAYKGATLTVLFFDEIDSFCRSRSASEDESTRRVKNVLLTQLDRTSRHSHVIILASTNRPWEIDEAALRRFPTKIECPLPDEAGRLQLARTLLRKVNHCLSDSDLTELARRTEG